METKVVEIDAANIDSAKITEAAALVDAGGLVAFPTETVYGIACRVKADSLAKLDGLKGRDPKKHYTLHISGKDVLGTYVQNPLFLGYIALSNRSERPISQRLQPNFWAKKQTLPSLPSFEQQKDPHP